MKVVHAVILASTFLATSAAAQSHSLAQQVWRTQGFIHGNPSSDGYTQLAAHLGPEVGLSVSEVTGQDAPFGQNAFQRQSKRTAFTAGAYLIANEPGSTDLAHSAKMQRTMLASAQHLATDLSHLIAPAGFVEVDSPTRRGHELPISASSMQDAALAALYNATRGDSWDNNTNWDPMSSPSIEEMGTWHGVTVHLGRLTELQLDDNNLTGTLPPEVGDLADLQVLWIDGNTLDGSIPKEFGQLSQLRTLLISHNEMSGAIPDQLGSLSELETLWLHDNGFTGAIPNELGSLTKLRLMVLSQNMLSGSIPDAIGSQGRLEILWLNDNALSGEVPQAIGDLSELKQLALDNNALSGSLPRSLLDLQKLEYLSFEGQSLCAPSDGAFQSWLSSVDVVKGPVCKEELRLTGSTNDLSFTLNRVIAPVAFPAATGGTAPYIYALNPALPAGLMFDPMSRFLTGNPSVISDPVGYTYTASDNAGAQASQMFSIEVVVPLSNADNDALPESFTLQGNYPNPFREATRVVVDLPRQAIVTIEVMDLIGRNVLTVPAVSMPAGWGQSVPLMGSALTSGLYLYRVQFSSREYTEVQFGRLLRVQ